ncbi:MAG TPA: Holliday junction branch migration protein RuvA [Bacteroidota bacterium]
MISSLRGILTLKSPTEVLIDVGGVGYAVSIPLSTYEVLGDLNSTSTLLTYLYVREDILQLFGFATEQERTAFKMLVSVSGIGPKMAQGILSGISVADLKIHIRTGNLKALIAIPGVGRKLAERLVLELRDKLERLDGGRSSGVSLTGSIHQEALLAMTSLGYSRATADKGIAAAVKETDGKSLTLEGLIKAALRKVTA